MDRMTEIGVYSTGPFAPVFARTAHLLTYSGAHGEEIHVNELSASISYSFNPQCNLSFPGHGAQTSRSFETVDTQNIMLYGTWAHRGFNWACNRRV